MNKRMHIPSDAALTDDLRPLADALVTAWTATDDAHEAVDQLADEAHDKEAQRADIDALKAAIATGKAPTKLANRHTDQLAAHRQIAAAQLDLATEAEAAATATFRTALHASSDALIDHAQTRADTEADAYRAAIAAFITARADYLAAVTDLGAAWSMHLDLEHRAATGTSMSSRRTSASDPGPDLRVDEVKHPRLPHDLRFEYLGEMLEADATRHEFPDPRERDIERVG